MRVLVTGGAGFIGSHVVDRLLAAGIAPRIFDVRQSEHHAAGEVDTVVGDLLDRTAVQAAMKGCDAVVHLAAAADVDDVALRPAEAEAVNARGTLNVLEAARSAGVSRVVYASTIWVYGSAMGTGRRGHHRGAARPPLHRDQARGRDVLPLLPGALRPGLHGPALRDPLRPARAARGR
jgi:UDP-glucose 4-epimerase